jgi:hypothetical protein
MRLQRRKGRRAPRVTETAGGRPLGSVDRTSEALARTALSALADLVAIVREMLVWPARVWLGVAEVAGEFVLTAWEAAVLPLLELGLRVLRAALRLGEREVTPARGLAVVALAATIALGASQFSDYRAVEVGAPSYRGLENVAPAPKVDPKSPRSAHGVAVFAIAIAALFVTVFAVGRNWRLARLLIVLGAAVILISLLVDAPEGLREGRAAITYEGAKAILLTGFWAQLFAAVALTVAGPLLAAQLRGERAGRRARPTGRFEAGVRAGTFSASAGGSGAEGAAT